jgi:membrane-bound ClpP family serine protease
MKAVARLVWSYFTGTPVLRACTIGGLILMAIDFCILLTQPNSGEKHWLAILGLIFFFIGSALMPVLFGDSRAATRLACCRVATQTTHQHVRHHPGGCDSAGVLAPASFISGSSSVPEFLKDSRVRDYVLQLAGITFTWAVLFAGWMYLAMWFLTSQRNMAGLFKGLLVITLVIFAPAREIRDLNVTLLWNLQQIAVIWIVFGAGFLLWPRFKAARARRNRERFPSIVRSLAGNTAGPRVRRDAGHSESVDAGRGAGVATVARHSLRARVSGRVDLFPDDLQRGNRCIHRPGRGA